MRIFLDECVPWPIHKIFARHSVTTATKKGWAGLKNGELLKMAESQFDLFITCDQNIRYQQNLQGRTIAIVELSTNDLKRLLAPSEQLLRLCDGISAVDFIQVDIP